MLRHITSQKSHSMVQFFEVLAPFLSASCALSETIISQNSAFEESTFAFNDVTEHVSVGELTI